VTSSPTLRSIPGPAPTREPDELAALLRSRLGPEAAVSAEPALRHAATRDYSWLSPVISSTIPRTVPDVVVWPGTVAAVERLAAFAYERRIPLTARGKGTSNYGQVVPLAGGIVVDFTRMTGEIVLDEEVVRAPAGTTFRALAAFLVGSGRELAMMPTTLQSTVAGFAAGGSGGPGTIEHGLNHEGFVRELTVVPVTEHPSAVDVAFPDTRAHVHSFGTTGLIVRVGLQTVPARQWTSVFASFADLDHGAQAALAVLESGPAPQVLAVTEPDLAALFPEDPALEPEATNFRAVVRVETVERVRAEVARAGGWGFVVRPDANRLLLTLINNHTTVRAKRARPELFHVLVRGNAVVGRRALIEAAYPGALVQLEGGRFGGRAGLSARILAPHRSDEGVIAGMTRLAAAGLEVENPHTWEVHQDLPPRQEVAERLDPAGLLNPGKLPRPAPARGGSTPTKGNL
jgi:FAD/FMN-containing dehydrogenase